MRKLLLAIVATFVYLLGICAPVNTLLKTSDGFDPRSWSLGRFPISGDTVFIPRGIQWLVTSNTEKELGNLDLYIKVNGSVYLDKGKLFLGKQSTLVLMDEYAYVDTEKSNDSEKISINGQTMYTGRDGLVTGPRYIDRSTATFTMIKAQTLPVKFVDFSLSGKDGFVQVSWSTAMEVNANRFEVERSLDGANWQVIAMVMAAGNSSELLQYGYRDRKPVGKIAYYRIRQVDYDGRFAYTQVRTFTQAVPVQTRAAQFSAVAGGKVLVQLNQDAPATVWVQFVSLSGQVLSQQKLQPTGRQFLLNNISSVKGPVVIRINDQRSLNASGQVLL